MERENTGTAENGKAAADAEYKAEGKDYLDGLIDKLASLGLADESYVNQLSDRLEPILGEL